MSNLFNGLESMGLQGLENVKIYDDEPKKTDNKAEKTKTPEVTEADYLFDKTYKCPVCEKEFKAKMVRAGKTRLIGSDSDLRPKYSGIDAIKYDAIVCPYCGYASLSRFFGNLTDGQIKLITGTVTANFKGMPEYGDIYTYDEALSRLKLVLLSTIVKKGKNSEKAYTCLKLAWVYRGLSEHLAETGELTEEKEKCCKNNENEMLKNALEGFVAARQGENFPVCGMDECTLDYLIADIAVRTGKLDLAEQMISNVIVSRNSNTRLKDKARTLRDTIKERK